MQWIGAAAVAVTLMLSGLAATNSAAAAPRQAAVQKPESGKVTELGARRRTWHHRRYAYRPYYPTYYDRPYYYAPAPFFPLLGLGYGPWW
jgi:hypothetical protein